MLEGIIGGPVCDQKRLAGEAFLSQTPHENFFEHTFLRLLGCAWTNLIM